ncbi:MAG: glycosyltransferase family 4 protein [Lentimicrobium sp.]
MNLLLLAPFKKSGGVASFVENILPFFSHPVHVFNRGQKDSANNYWNFFLMIITPFRFVATMLQYKPDKVIINSSLSFIGLLRDGMFIVISKIFRKKVLLIIHGFQDEALKHRQLLQWGYFNADSIIVLAKSFSDALIKEGYKGSIYTQWNPVSLEILESDHNISDDIVRDKISILFLARIEEVKGIFTSINAFKIVQEIYPNVVLNIAGSGKALSGAQMLAKKMGLENINFYGFLSGHKKMELLKSNYILLFPTTHREGLPINVLEAMASGLIIVTRPVGGLIDLFSEMNFGYLIESKEPKEFAQTIISIIENYEKMYSIRRSNEAFAKDNFHPKTITERIEGIIGKL